MNKRTKFSMDPDTDEVATVEEVPDFEDDLDMEYLTDHIKDDFERVFGEDAPEGPLNFNERRDFGDFED